MIIRASNISASLDVSLPGNEKFLHREVARAIGVKAEQISSIEIVRRSIDARKKDNVHFVLSCDVDIPDIKTLKRTSFKPAKGVNISEPPLGAIDKSMEFMPAPNEIYGSSAAYSFDTSNRLRPVVVGAGPAGLFCALYLARAGMRPILLERGEAVEDRQKTVQAFNAGAPLNSQSNIQFGEGGAGAFSDGKLTTGTKDKHIREVLEEFVAAGAPADILVNAKPHIGTDYLPRVVAGIRASIIEAGGEVLFNTQLIGVDFEALAELSDGRDGIYYEPRENAGDRKRCQFKNEEYAKRLKGIVVRNVKDGMEEYLACDTLILAIGHSARDTLEVLHEAGITMERKPFAMGVRIEHSQQTINEAQYGKASTHPALPPADYKLNVRTHDGRGVYTFCICPGGEVVAAASEDGGVCVNGMSNFARDGRNANSALLVEVRPEDFDGEDVLAGMYFQRQLEQAAFIAAQAAGAYAAPAQTVGEFLRKSFISQVHSNANTDSPSNGDASSIDDSKSHRTRPLSRLDAALDSSSCANLPSKSVVPTYPRGVAWVDLHECLPPLITDAIEEALPKLDRKLHGFASESAVMTAVEARSSSPVRILRDKHTLQSVSVGGVYPAGEGAGYAGGIMSAATDGIRVAERIIENASAKDLAKCPTEDLTGNQVGYSPKTQTKRQMEQNIESAVNHLKRGEAVIFPTDTVYGLGVAVKYVKSPQELYELKLRAKEKPIAWLVGSPDDLANYGQEIPSYAQKLANAFWPGPLTLIVNAGAMVPEQFKSAAGTLGIRMPQSDIALELIKRTGSPLATTSANVSGAPDAADVTNIDEALLANVPYVLAADNASSAHAKSHISHSSSASNVENDAPRAASSAHACISSGIASTVIDCTGKSPRIIREGSITSEDMSQALI